VNSTDLDQAEHEELHAAYASLYTIVGEPILVAGSAHFVARDKFVEDFDGELPIGRLGPAFKKCYLSVVEENVAGAHLKQRRQMYYAADGPALAAVGDADLHRINTARIALAHMFEFLKMAEHNQTTYRFYVADQYRIVMAVTALHQEFDDGRDHSTRGYGWDIECYSVFFPFSRGDISTVVTY